MKTEESLDERAVYKEMASFTGKLFRDNFGKGPASVYVSIEKPFVTIYLRDFLTPMEQVLVRKKNHLKVEETRDLLMQELIPEIKAKLLETASIQVDKMYYDWSLKDRSGIVFGVIKPNNKEEKFDSYPDYSQKKAVHDEVIRVSKKAEKVPDKVESLYLNDRTLVVERKGVLVEIEKELIRSGFREQLRLSKRRLEKRLLEKQVSEGILNTPVTDIFVDWDFDEDRSYIIYILKPNKI